MIAGGQYRIVVNDKDWGMPWSFWPMGDIHWWNAACDEAAADDTLGTIADDPLSRMIGMGDYNDLIGTQDKRFDGDSIAPAHVHEFLKGQAGNAKKHMSAKFKPIADQNKLIGLHLGNHEWKFDNKMESAIVQDVCEELKVPFLGYAALHDICFEHKKSHEARRFRVMSHHGAGYALTKGGKINRLERFMDDFDAEVYLIGHLHETLDDEKVRLGADPSCNRLIAHTRIAIMTGTYLKTYCENPDGSSTYGERAAYRPTAIGTPRLGIVPESGRLFVEKPKGHLRWRV